MHIISGCNEYVNQSEAGEIVQWAGYCFAGGQLGSISSCVVPWALSGVILE